MFAHRSPVEIAACTIVSNNYLGMARVLAESYLRHHPGEVFHVCVADEPAPEIDYGALPFRVVFARELDIPRFASFAFRYDQIELATAVKPFLLRRLRDRTGADAALYLDPDILVFRHLSEVRSALSSDSLVLTPHITQPLDNERDPSERRLRMCGIYNLGFLGVRFDPAAGRFLDWWAERLERFCLMAPSEGLFVDQAWVDFAPAFLDRVHILRDPGYNVAYWNLPHRAVAWDGERAWVEGRPAAFFHFSGFSADDLRSVSRHENRLGDDERRRLRPLLEHYSTLLEQAGHGRFMASEYGYRAFRPAGPPIGQALRRALLRIDPRGKRWPDPFDLGARDSFHAYLTAPLEVPFGTLNRAVLALWEIRPDLQRRCPDPGGPSLNALLDWLQTSQDPFLEGQLHASFWEGLTAHQETFSAASRQLPHLLRLPRPSEDHRYAALLAALDLEDPGPLAKWLLEPLAAAQGRGSLPRVAYFVWKADEGVRQRFPDPFRKDRRRFLRFLAGVDGEAPLALGPDLRAGLTVGAGWHWPWRPISTAGKEPSVPPPAMLPACLPPDAPISSTRPALPDEPVGVTVAFRQRASAWEHAAARTLIELGSRCSFPVSSLPLDVDFHGAAIESILSMPQGAPYPVSVVASSICASPWDLQRFPLAALAGGYRIAWWDWPLLALPETLSGAASAFHEVWAPTRCACEAFAGWFDVPVRYLPPSLSFERSAGVIEDLDPNRFWILGDALEDSPASLAPPEWCAWLVGEAARTALPDLGLVLRFAGDVSEARRAELAAMAAPAPVIYRETRAGDPPEFALLRAVRAYVSLPRATGLAVGLAAAMAAGVPCLGVAIAGAADLLDRSTGFPIPYGLARLGPAPEGLPPLALCALPRLEQGVKALLALRDASEEVARRCDAAERRVHELYGEQAGIRLCSRLEQIHRSAPERPEFFTMPEARL